MNEQFFKGPTERYLIDKLKEDGELSFQEILKHYTSDGHATSFIEKLEVFKIAKVDYEKRVVKYELL